MTRPAAALAFALLCTSVEAREVVTRVNPRTPAGVSDVLAGAYITARLFVRAAGSVERVDISHWSTTNRTRVDPASFKDAHQAALTLFGDAVRQAARQWTFAPAGTPSTEVVGFAFDTSTTTVGRALRRVTPTFVTQWFSDWLNTPAPPVRVGGQIAAPPKVTDRAPMYPGRAGELTGPRSVVLDIQTRRNGSVAHAHILTSAPGFDQYAIDAALGWKYAPLRVDGTAAEAVMTVSVEFAEPRAAR